MRNFLISNFSRKGFNGTHTPADFLRHRIKNEVFSLADIL